MAIEIIISAIVIALAIYGVYNSFKKKKSGGCGCGGCDESNKKRKLK